MSSTFSRFAAVGMVLMVVVLGQATAATTAPARPAVKSAASAGSASPAAAGFYDVPDPLPPGAPGDIIKSEQVSAPGLHGTAYRVMYHSRSIRGADIAVTGLIAVPAAAAPAGGYPVISWAHGTTGIADVCAPSKSPNDSSLLQLGNLLLDKGYLAVGTDYEGLGTPGRHPYIVGQSEARGVIDIVRAARRSSFAHASRNWLVWGHSQGGHAALFAGQIASTWAPELNLVGTVAGAPPSQLKLVYLALRTSPFRYYLLMAGAGIAAAYPNLDLSDVATPLALSKLHVVDEGCEGEIDAAYRNDATADLLKTDPYTLADWKAAIDAQEPGTVRTDNPILIIHGGNDEQIPVVSSQLLLERMCGLGQVVQRRVYPGQSHAGVIGPSFAGMLTWMADRFAGRAAPNDCKGGVPITATTSSVPITEPATTTTVDVSGTGGDVTPADGAAPVSGSPSFTG